MAATTLVRRAANQIRNAANRCLFSYRSLTQSTPSISHLQHPPQPLLPAVGSSHFLQPASFHHRFRFSTSATDASGKIDKEGEEPQSNQDDKTGSGAEAGKSVRGGPVSWLSFVLLVLTGAGILVYYDKQKKQHIEAITKASEAVKEGPSVGKAAIGGPFSLIDHNGKPVTEKDFKGQWNILYFGFTHCPDICPDELQKLASAIDKIKEKSGLEVVPLFISVDPERDTVEQVREYIQEFHPKLIGLTGSLDEVKNVARAYRVYYMKTAEEDSDYLVDHSIVMYLMDPEMQFVKFFGRNNTVDELADGVIKEMMQ